MKKNLIPALSISAVLLVALGIVGIVNKAPQKVSPTRLHADVIAPSTPAADPSSIVAALQHSEPALTDVDVKVVSGIVILRGETRDAASAARATMAVQNLGYSRVANLIHVTPQFNDEDIRRSAERQIAQNRSLDGCHFAISCNQGILKVSATVQSEAQEEVTRSVLKSVTGVREVRAEFARF
jgi:osmotically-inducible protein OsmY